MLMIAATLGRVRQVYVGTGWKQWYQSGAEPGGPLEGPEDGPARVNANGEPLLRSLGLVP